MYVRVCVQATSGLDDELDPYEPTSCTDNESSDGYEEVVGEEDLTKYNMYKKCLSFIVGSVQPPIPTPT